MPHRSKASATATTTTTTIAIAISVLSFARIATAAPFYTVTPVAPHDASRRLDIEATAMNQVGGVAGVDLTHDRSFRWSAADGLQWLDDLPTGSDSTTAWGLNDAGVVVGMGHVAGSDYAGQVVERAVAWMPGQATPVDLQAGLDPKAHRQQVSVAYAVNGAGIVSGIAGTVSGTDGFTLDLASHTPTALGDPFYPYALNDAGQTAGAGPYDPQSGRLSMQWRAADGRRVVIPGAISVRALNASGATAGQTSDFRAYVWSEAAGLAVLPSLDALPFCEAEGLNAAGVAIGTCDIDGEAPRAVLWTPDGGGGYVAQDVHALVAPDPRRPEGCLTKPGGAELHCFGTLGVGIDDAGRLLVNEIRLRHRETTDSQPLLLTPPAR